MSEVQPSERLPPWAALQYRNFALLWCGQLIHMMGAWMQQTVRAWQIYQLTDSPLAVGLLGFIGAVPILIFSIVGGAIADSMDRRRLILVTQSISMGLTMVLAALTSTGLIEPWMIYLIAFLSAITTSFDSPARQAMVPTLVPTTHINNAVTLLLVIRQLGLMIGPPIGGFVVASFGIAPAYWINAASYLPLIGAIMALNLPALTGHSRPRLSFSMLRDGAVFVWGTPIVLAILAIDFVSTFVGVTRGILPSFARDIFASGPQGLGLLAGSPAVGGVVGIGAALVLGDVRRKGVGIIVCTLGFGLAILGFGAAPSMVVACICLAGYGFVDALGDTMRHTLLQTATPDALRGRVNSVAIMLGHGGPQLGQLWVGLLATAFGPRESMLFGGAVIIVFALTLSVMARQLIAYRAHAQLVTA